jgi:hypothetical protein
MKRMQPAEQPLLPDHQSGKWWIMNSVTRDETGKAVHISALLSMDLVESKNYSSCYYSIYREADSGYYFNMNNAGDSVTGFKRNFPVKIIIPAKDSTTDDWSWTLNRQSLDFKTRVQKDYNSPKTPATLDISYVFKKQDPFALIKINSIPGIWVANPLPVSAKLSGEIKLKTTGQLSLSIFSGHAQLLEKAKKGFVHWLDCTLISGMKISVLYSTGNNGEVKTEAAIAWDASGAVMLRPAIQLLPVEVINNETTRLKKPYPLYFTISIPGYKGKLSLKPRIINQELRANKSSFWMGAIELTDEESGMQEGLGNMYIFRQ